MPPGPPYDIIGDVHGCHAELQALLTRLGYAWGADGLPRHPEGRVVVFVGDLVDRGPASDAVLTLAMRMCEQGAALAVVGNHDDKLARKLRGRNVKIAHGLERTLTQIAPWSDVERDAAAAFILALPHHLILDEGRLVVAHAGLDALRHGTDGPRTRALCLYGPTTGKLDADGLPQRIDWALGYTGEPLVVYGHTPVTEARWVGRTLCIDTGCVFGGALTALRYPELERVQVPAEQVWMPAPRPLKPPPPTSTSAPA